MAPREDGLSPEEREYRDAITPHLLRQAYHLPGNNWIEVCKLIEC